VQRALAAGSTVLGKALQLDAGDTQAKYPENWQRVSQSTEALSTESAFHAGAYTAEDRLLAVNRPLVEDTATVLGDDRVANLFRGLNFARVDDQAGNLGTLIQEIWRLFMATMLVALLMEAALCLPKLARKPSDSPTSKVDSAARSLGREQSNGHAESRHQPVTVHGVEA
jgi:hypothetical protein